jgi:hypothetical protein
MPLLRNLGVERRLHLCGVPKGTPPRSALVALTLRKIDIPGYNSQHLLEEYDNADENI